MRVIIGHFGHEANTFSEKMASYEEFTQRGPTFGEASILAHEGTPSYLGGIIRACREDGVEMVPTCAHTAAAPVLDQDCTERMLESILSVCRENKGKVDGVCIALHGAGVSEQSDDLESFVLKKIREILGNEIPITVPLDLHGNISQEMATLAQGLFGIRKYPHTDKAEASYLAMKTLTRMIREGVRVRSYVVHLPLMLPISAGQTAKAPFPEMETYFKKYIAREGLIDACLFHGFPYADVADGTASVVVVSENEGKAAAEHLAQYVWEQRDKFCIESRTPAEAFALAKETEKEGYIVINEASDNPGGGCPGDGTHLLREMLKENLPRSIFGYMVDAECADILFRHRPGDRVDLTLGGKHEKIFGEPLVIRDAEIISLSNGVFRHTSPNLRGVETSLGKSARIRVGNVEIIIGSNRNQTFDDRPFAVLGADLREYRYVGLKSTQHFQSFFGDKAARIISCDPPGLNSADLHTFEYKKIPRPVYPLDEGVVFCTKKSE